MLLSALRMVSVVLLGLCMLAISCQAQKGLDLVEYLERNSLDHRNLQECENDLTTIYYEVNVTLSTLEPSDIRCNEAQLYKLGELVDTALESLDLNEKYFGFVDVQNHLCLEEPHYQQDYRVSSSTVYSSSFSRRTHGRKLPSVRAHFIYHQVFAGGGRCRFCLPDNFDYRKNRLLQSLPQLRGGSSATAATQTNQGPNPRNDDNEAATTRLLQSQGLPCGCKVLDFSRDGQGLPIVGTPYVDKAEYSDSLGVRIYVNLPIVNDRTLGYAPSKKSRIYDTRQYVYDDRTGDKDLGSPNQACPGGGPGVGDGGGPFLKDNEDSNDEKTPNPGANCDPQGNALIIQESNKDFADDSLHGGEIVFSFVKGPVTLRHVTVMDIGQWDRESHLKVEFSNEDGTRAGSRYFAFQRYGDNSVEKVVINMDRVTRVVVKLAQSGAVSELAFCNPEEASCAYPKNEEAATMFTQDMIPLIEEEARNSILHTLYLAEVYERDYCLRGIPVEPNVTLSVTRKKDLQCY